MFRFLLERFSEGVTKMTTTFTYFCNDLIMMSFSDVIYYDLGTGISHDFSFKETEFPTAEDFPHLPGDASYQNDAEFSVEQRTVALRIVYRFILNEFPSNKLYFCESTAMPLDMTSISVVLNNPPTSEKEITYCKTNN